MADAAYRRRRLPSSLAGIRLATADMAGRGSFRKGRVRETGTLFGRPLEDQGVPLDVAVHEVGGIFPGDQAEAQALEQKLDFFGWPLVVETAGVIAALVESAPA